MTGNFQPSQSTSEEEKERSIPGAGKFGMILFLLSLTMLFAASMTGYLVIRFRQESWPPPGMPRLPGGLWFSTLVLILSSFTIQKALGFIKQDQQNGLRKMLIATTVLGVVFLLSQTYNWIGLISLKIAAKPNLYAFTFFLLTALHAIHVVGGLFLLGVVTTRAYRGRYSSHFHPGVLYSTMYWHFLDGVWIIMFLLLMLEG